MTLAINRRRLHEHVRFFSSRRAARFAFMVVAALAFGALSARPVALTEEQWREDALQMVEAIREIHPNPWRHIQEPAFVSGHERLLDQFGSLDDQAIVVRMAALVAGLGDGHTRLTIPRRYPSLAESQSHSGTAPPEHDALVFDALPIKFESFSDGLFVVAAAPAYRHLLGARLDAIGDMAASRAMDVVGEVVSGENDGFRQMMSADRISMPGVLRALGVISDGSEVAMTFTTRAGREIGLTLQPHRGPIENWVDAHGQDPIPLWRRNPDRKYWWAFLPEKNLVYLQIDEIANLPDDPIAAVVGKAISAAEEANARLVIDLRWNYGGSGSFNRPIVLGLLASDRLNRFGRTFVLTGRRTFSAAQMLVNDLEKWSRAVFVGLPTGSRPDHYGDSRKVRLTNSGLTLRVSTLHWAAHDPRDERNSVSPLVRAPFSTGAWFGGKDPALDAIVSFPDKPDAVSLFGMALEGPGERRAARFMTDHFLNPETLDVDLSERIISLSEQFVGKGKPDLADLALRYGLYFYPGHEALANALSALEQETP